MIRKAEEFTFIELLIVVLILSLLAAIIFPAMARAKKNALLSSDTAQLRQTYVAIKLYEQDHGQMPDDLTKLVPGYLPKEILRVAGDTRPRGTDGLYPAIMSCYVSLGDPACPRVPYMVSYAYFKTFEHRFPPSLTFQAFAQDPNVGLLAALQHLELKTLITACWDAPGADHSLGTCHDSGHFLRVRMDGSIVRVLWRPEFGVQSGCAWDECFTR